MCLCVDMLTQWGLVTLSVLSEYYVKKHAIIKTVCLSVSEHAKGHMLSAYTGQSPGVRGRVGNMLTHNTCCHTSVTFIFCKHNQSLSVIISGKR